jgi:hypothetical protein
MMIQARHGHRHGVRSKLFCAALGAAMLCACHNTNNNAVLGTKGLWIANGMNVIEYIPSQFKPGVLDSAPHIAINSTVFGAPQGVTFDAMGNLWVIDPGATVNGVKNTPALFEFNPTQLAELATNADPDPVATITSAALNFPQQAAFDGAGNLWVTDHGNNTVLVFSLAQVSATGITKVTPMVTLSATPAFNGPLGITFDAAKNLWVANNGSNGTSPIGTTIVEFTAAKLAGVMATAAATLVPDVTLSDDGQGSIQGPWQLFFDASGNLWSSNANPPSTLVRFMQSSLAATGNPVPGVTISPTMVSGNPSLDAPNGLCLDQNGNVAATNSANAFGVPFYGVKQLMNGSPTPDTFFIGATTTLNAPAGCEFGTLIN